MRALLLTPREHFVTNPNLSRVWTASSRHRLRSDDQRSAHRRAHDHCAECCARRQGARGRNRFRIPIGLSRPSTDKVWSIEIIKPLAERTRRLYDSLIERGYDEYKSITTRHADGYYGWDRRLPSTRSSSPAPSTYPPPLLQQMKPNGIMVIPVGPPGAQCAQGHQAAGCRRLESIARSDIYHGGRVSFVPFTRLERDLIKGAPSASDWRF